MRKDQNLSPDELGKLWESDAKRVLLEWSYRIYDTTAAIENPASFVQYLFQKFKDSGGARTVSKIDLNNLSNMTDAYQNGRISLNQWTDSVRSNIGHESRKIIQPIGKTNPEVQRHLLNVLSNYSKKTERK